MEPKKYTFWGYTLNNYSDAELVLVRTPPEWVREHIYTLEKGESGTPHVQGYARLFKHQKISFLSKRWLPRASFRPLSTDEYQENMKAYVQKQDSTATSATHQVRNVDMNVYPAMIPEMLVKSIYIDNRCEPFYGWEKDFVYIKDAPIEFKDLVNEAWDDEFQKHTVNCFRFWRGHGDVPRPERFVPLDHTFAIPWELALEAAKRTLARQYRVETLLYRPEIDRCLTLRLHILYRIKENANQTHDEEAQRSEEAETRSEVTLPTTPDSEDS